MKGSEARTDQLAELDRLNAELQKTLILVSELEQEKVAMLESFQEDKDRAVRLEEQLTAHEERGRFHAEEMEKLKLSLQDQIDAITLEKDSLNEKVSSLERERLSFVESRLEQSIQTEEEDELRMLRSRVEELDLSLNEEIKLGSRWKKECEELNESYRSLIEKLELQEEDKKGMIDRHKQEMDEFKLEERRLSDELEHYKTSCQDQQKKLDELERDCKTAEDKLKGLEEEIKNCRESHGKEIGEKMEEGCRMAEELGVMRLQLLKQSEEMENLKASHSDDC